MIYVIAIPYQLRMNQNDLISPHVVFNLGHSR